MNDNEKTFADLFSSSGLDDDNQEKKEEGTTFESLVNGIFNDNDDSNNVSFGDINDVLGNEQEDVIEQSEILTNDDIISNNVFFEEDKQDLDGVLKEEDRVDKNLFFDNDIVNDGDEILSDSSGGSLVLEKEEIKEDIVVDNKSEETKLFFNDEKKSEELVVGSNNNSFSEVIDSNLFFDNSVDKKNDVVLNEDKNLFFSDSIEKEEKIVSGEDNNVFFNDSLEKNDNVSINGDNKVVSVSSVNSNENKNAKNEVISVSPFFEESSLGLEKMSENILGDNRISFDQTKKVNSNVNKLDLSGAKNFNVKLVKKKVPFTKFVIGVISYAFFIFLVLILVTLLAYVLDIKVRAAKGDYSAPTFNAYVVLTGSMLPQIQVKDVVVTKKVPTEELKVGDIITFASSDTRFLGTIITHRIIKKNQDSNGNVTFQTRGDNNNVADSALVQPSNIFGKVILKVPKLGYLQDFLATQGGWIICILFPCLGVISYDIVKLGKGIKKKKNKIKVIK